MVAHTLTLNTALDTILGFRKLPAAERSILADSAVLRVFAAHSIVTTAGVHGGYGYIIVRGTLEAFITDRDQHEIDLRVVQVGEAVGIGALFGATQRLATVRARETVYALQFKLDDLKERHQHLPMLFEWLERDYRQLHVLATLGRVPLFSQLSRQDRQTISRSFARRHFERNTLIFEAGTPGYALYLIEQGQIVVEQDGMIISTLTVGDFFGEMSLLTNAPHNAAVRTVTSAICLELPGDVFAELVRKHPSLEAGMRDVIDQRLQQAALMHDDEERMARLQVAVAHGMLRGSHILVRTPSLCPPDCRICEEACAERFGQTRIHLNGVMLGELDVTVSCRQCRVGAECVEACPEDAIQWDDSGAYFINDACTGCGDCVPACPYNAMEMQEIRLEQRDGPLWMLWRRMRGLPPPLPPRLVASKCDLCYGYDDRACLSRCPTGSLQLMPVEELFPL